MIIVSNMSSPILIPFNEHGSFGLLLEGTCVASFQGNRRTLCMQEKFRMDDFSIYTGVVSPDYAYKFGSLDDVFDFWMTHIEQMPSHSSLWPNFGYRMYERLQGSWEFGDHIPLEYEVGPLEPRS